MRINRWVDRWRRWRKTQHLRIAHIVLSRTNGWGPNVETLDLLTEAFDPASWSEKGLTDREALHLELHTRTIEDLLLQIIYVNQALHAGDLLEVERLTAPVRWTTLDQYFTARGDRPITVEAAWTTVKPLWVELSHQLNMLVAEEDPRLGYVYRRTYAMMHDLLHLFHALVRYSGVTAPTL